MATRADAIPGFDVLNDNLASADLMRIAQEHGVDIEDALRLAREGDVLELELLRSGFYGDAEVPPEVIDQGLALRNLGDLLIRLREAAVERRWGVDEQTLLNFAFNAGHHYIEVDRARRVVVPIPAPRGAVRRKVQKFAPWYRAQHSKLSGGDPQYHVEATTRQQEDKDAAEMAGRIARWLAQELHSHKNRSESAMWKLLAGSCIIACEVDYEEDPDYLATIDPETGEAVIVPKPVIRFEILPPQVVWADDRQSTIEDMRWIGRDIPTTIAEAIARWPEHAALFAPEIGADERGHAVLRRTQRLTSIEEPWHERTMEGSGVGAIDEEEEVLILEFYGAKGIALQGQFLDRLDPEVIPVEVVSPEDYGGEPVVVFPEGLHVFLTTDGHILEIEPNPYDDLPFREDKFTKSSGFWTVAPATHLREINQAMNWALSMWEEALLRTGRPKELIPRQARVNRRQLSNVAQRVFYRANHQGAKPEYMSPPSMPADGIRLFEVLEMLWQDVAGLHEVSQGRLPASGVSGVAVSLLQEQDLSQLGFAGEEMEQAYAAVMRKALRYVQQYFPRNDPRLLKLAGDAPYLIDAFMDADLDDGLDIRVVKGSAIPRSPAAIKAEAAQAWEMGFMVDRFGRPDFRRMQEVFELGTAEELYAEDEINTQNARAVQDMILSLPPEMALVVLQQFEQTGKLPPPLQPQPEDDHMLMEREHRIRLQRLRHDPRVHPINVALLRAVWQIHLMAIAPLAMQTDPAVVVGAGMGAPMLGPGEEGGEEGDEAQEES